ncbi:uracil-DNA glycosylase [Candidatus Woesearchaeota archaeon]|nr:uracil-DNA glycosylase [Candidatus Woesearchaeota archaeon]
MPETLFSLAEQIRRCTACPLWKQRTLAVPGEGPKNAKLLFIGEAPGVEEDRQGLPFVGRSGKFLTEMLNQIGIDRKTVFITGSVKCHPPKNRVPKTKELAMCKELWLDKQVSLLKPKLIVLLGSVAIQSSLGEKKDLANVHGLVVEKEGLHYFLTYHPSAAMRFPAVRKLMEDDFKKLKRVLN